MKSKVIFILVPCYSNNAWLDAKMMQMTKSFIEVLNLRKQYPIVTVDTYEQTNDYLNKAEFLVVVTAGNAIIERDVIWNKIHTIPNDVGIISHLLQYSNDETPYIHEQFFIIRTSVFKNLDFNTGSDVGLELIRSEEDMHNGNAPLYIEYGNKQVTRNFKFGTKLIIDCLDKGYRAINFDQSWRWPSTHSGYVQMSLPCRGYCYPKKKTELFSNAFKELKLVDGLDESQEMFIRGIQEALKFKVLNAWSYDELSIVDADHIVAPATGFLGEMLAIKNNASKVTFYDINKNNLEFKKHLYDNWDGVDYNKFVHDWAYSRNLSIEPVLQSTKIMSNNIYTDMDLLYNHWRDWVKDTDVEFIHCDLIKDIDLIESKLTPMSVIHTSTILTVFPFTHILYDEIEINNVRNILKKHQWIES